MAGSDISITTASGTGTIPIATLKDVNQSVSPVHVVPTLLSGQLGALQTDANGRLLTLASPGESHLGEVRGISPSSRRNLALAQARNILLASACQRRLKFQTLGESRAELA